MRFLLPLCCLYICLPPPKWAPISKVEVLDGDTIIFWRGGKQFKGRLAYIDTPEMDQRDSCGYKLGIRAREELQVLLGENPYWHFLEKDRYGREIGLLKSGGRTLNLEILREGWAVFYPFAVNPYHPSLKSYRQASKQAYFEKRGLYALCSWHYPASFRRLKREKKLPKLEKSR